MSIDINKIPELPGVYIIKDLYERIIYIGKSKNLKKRVGSYFVKKSDEDFKTASIKLLAFKMDFIICDSEREALIVERKLISEHSPFFNTLWKDSKTYPYIAITKEDFPRILITRSNKIKGSYFGPYPKSDITKKLIEKLSELKIINLRKCNHNFSIKKPLSKNIINKCIYYHTGQCVSPCDSEKISLSEYKKLVLNAKKFFQGEHYELMKYFKEKMKKSSKNLDFENAKIYRDAMRAIEHIYERVSVNERNLKEIELKANFTNTLISIKEKLELKKIPYHIESFDISNLYNRWAVGGMVCFVNGKKNHSHYRHFKIKSTVDKGSNDYMMIQEIVKRRLMQCIKNNEGFPDLLLIDGGRGQISMAFRAAKELKLDIDIISIAKSNEEIYTLYKKEPYSFEKDSNELLFLRMVRDETHRFAIGYHRKLRAKEFLIE